jgi:hypothetical protein
MQMYCTFVLFVNQHFPGLPASGTHCIKKNTESWSRNKCRENQVYVAISSPECRSNRDVKIANRSFENVAQFKYLEMTVTNQNLIQEDIKRRLKGDLRDLYSSPR